MICRSSSRSRTAQQQQVQRMLTQEFRLQRRGCCGHLGRRKQGLIQPVSRLQCWLLMCLR